MRRTIGTTKHRHAAQKQALATATAIGAGTMIAATEDDTSKTAG